MNHMRIAETIFGMSMFACVVCIGMVIYLSGWLIGLFLLLAVAMLFLSALFVITTISPVFKPTAHILEALYLISHDTHYNQSELISHDERYAELKRRCSIASKLLACRYARIYLAGELANRTKDSPASLISREIVTPSDRDYHEDEYSLVGQLSKAAQQFFKDTGLEDKITTKLTGVPVTDNLTDAEYGDDDDDDDDENNKTNLS